MKELHFVSSLGFMLLVGCVKAPTEAEPSPPRRPVPEASLKQPADTGMRNPPEPMAEIKPRQLTPYNPAPTQAPYLACFSPNGKTVVSACAIDIWVWDVETGKETVKMKHAKVAILALAVSPNGMTVAAAGEDGVIRLWDPATGEEKAVFEQETPVEALAFSPDGKTLAAGGGYKTWLWEVATGKVTQSLRETPRGEVFGIPIGGVFCVAFSPDGKLLATGGDFLRERVSKPVCLWDTATGKEKAVLNASGKGSPTRSLAFSPDGKTLVAVGEGVVLHWDVATGRDVVPCPEATFVHDADSVAFSSDGKTLAVGSRRGMVYFRDVATGKYRAYGEGHMVGRSGADVRSLAFSPDGKTLASAGQDGTVQLWDVPMAK